MYDEPVGMGPVPAGRCIGRKARVHHGYGRFIILLPEVLEERPELPHEKHPLIYDSPAGQGGDVGIHAALLKLPADDIEHPVKIQVAYS